jgi:hypothetical protein
LEDFDMPFRPTAPHRRNIRGVIYPLTAAIERTYGVRADGAWPLGAFYTVNVDSTVWRPVGGIWYVPHDAEKVFGRSINEDVIADFCKAIQDGRVVALPSGRSITWEAIPNVEASQLP